MRASATATIAGRSLETAVVVQCRTSEPETRDLLALADRDRLIDAVVGWADRASPGLGDVLDDLLAGPGGPYLRSLGHVVQGESDPAWLQRPDVDRGLQTVARCGLGYDVLIRSHEFRQAVRLAERHPELRLVLDRAGKPRSPAVT
ncbi:amidohydrolase family protein [Streptomyces sp. NPDC020917]|uniref:amidohydrolase family protein n=1 Tax=Streptomyces sp. NPDC020917 TaxID=3365102 RepID=UPI0037907A51